MTILLVEDDKDLQEMYGLQLRHGGHKVKVASHAQVALDILDKNQIDLLLLDVLLPQHNGLSLLYELRSYEDWLNLPIIILSNVPVKEVGLTPQMMDKLRVAAYLNKGRTKPAQLLFAVESARNE